MSTKKIVQNGYDRIAHTYLATQRATGEDIDLLHELICLLPKDARVLDAGCGAGVPITRILAEHARVTGVDISAAQIALARELVPTAHFIQADLTEIDVAEGAFDAICSYYAIIHIPRDEHGLLLGRFHRMLAPGGYLLASMGASDNPDDREDNWLGAGAAMYWSHYGRAKNLRLIEDAGFEIGWERLVREDEAFGGGSHLFVLARKLD